MQAPTAPPLERATPRYSLPGMVGYFLRLGTIRFGRPIVLAAYRQRDLVDERK